MTAERLPDLPVGQAASRWLEDKRLYIQARTLRDYEQYFHALAQFFGDLPLKNFTIGNVRSFQKWRQENGPTRTDKAAPKAIAAGAGALRINNEVRALGQLLTEGRVWHKIKPYYKPLPAPFEGPGLALTQAQAKHLFEVAGSKKRWETALWCALLQTQTTLGPGELRHLQLGDVNLEQGELMVRRAVKNRFRVRTIFLNKRAAYALRKLLARAKEKGSTAPDHYLLPHHSSAPGQEYDPTKPQGGWRTAWDALRKAAGFPKLRPYDMRHTAVTWMLQDPTVPIQGTVETAGWVDPKMIRKYSHQAKATKRRVVQALDQLDLFDPPAPPAKKNAIEDMLDSIAVDPKKLQ